MSITIKRSVICILAVALVGAGCGSDTEPQQSAVGAYGLQSVDGSPLPFLGLQADTLYPQSDGTVRRFFLQDGTGTVYPTEGTYAVSGSEVSFTSYTSAVPHSSAVAQGTATASYGSGSITLNRDNDVLVYLKKR